MATDANENPVDSNKSQDTGSEGDKGKLFFGKYKSLEEAENGFKELERSFHAKAQEASTYKEIVDKIGTSDYHSDDNYNRATQPANHGKATQELTEFYANPTEWREKVKKEAIEEARKVISGETKQVQELSSRVNAWASKNSDVAEHQDLLEVYVKRTDARLNPETRLDLAAAEVRKRLAALRGTKVGNDKVDTNTVDGEPGSFRDASGQHQQQQQGQPASGETELASYASSRNKNRIKRPGTHH